MSAAWSDALDSPRLMLAAALLARRRALMSRARTRLLWQRSLRGSHFRACAASDGVRAAARLCFRVAETLRLEAASAGNLRAARSLYRLAMCGSRTLRPRARERLLLMLFQCGLTERSRAAP